MTEQKKTAPMHSDTIYNDPDKLNTTASGFIDVIRVEKPWGKEELVVRTPDYVLKFLHINAGCELSLQYHKKKRETLRCTAGSGVAILGFNINDQDAITEHPFKEGDVLHIEPNTIHTYRAITDMVLVEASTPHIDDVVRLKDRYGRVEK